MTKRDKAIVAAYYAREDRQLNLARIQNGAHPDYRNGWDADDSRGWSSARCGFVIEEEATFKLRYGPAAFIDPQPNPNWVPAPYKVFFIQWDGKVKIF